MELRSKKGINFFSLEIEPKKENKGGRKVGRKTKKKMVRCWLVEWTIEHKRQATTLNLHQQSNSELDGKCLM
ncbi:hypothetical protein V6N12_050950 [Hibiscus sabdariffa]|uniref:Uncharacterized protein n=1 Tax=Hibiscus sabdariffa TaxID=183260 RepID=A0ABR2GDW8_9ROSI